LVDNKVAESIKFLNEESRRSATDDDYFKYALNAKNIIKSDLNQDGKTDYVVEASFCEETNCHSTTMTYEVFIFTTDQQDQINFITDLNWAWMPKSPISVKMALLPLRTMNMQKMIPLAAHQL
jgi:hypothetical protein